MFKIKIYSGHIKVEGPNFCILLNLMVDSGHTNGSDILLIL